MRRAGLRAGAATNPHEPAPGYSYLDAHTRVIGIEVSTRVCMDTRMDTRMVLTQAAQKLAELNESGEDSETESYLLAVETAAIDQISDQMANIIWR